MSFSATLLNYIDHGQLKIADGIDLSNIKKQQIIPLVVHEFSIASASMPIVFVKNSETGEFQSVALLGFKLNENLLIKNNQWQGSYQPAILKQAPFALLPHHEDQTQLQLVINEASALCNKEQGQPLFDEQGEETSYLQTRKKQLVEYYEQIQTTTAFINALVSYGLLAEQNLTLEVDGDKIALEGLYLVNEQKLQQLDDHQFLQLRHKGYLAPIYHHLTSMHQLANLVRLNRSK